MRYVLPEYSRVPSPPYLTYQQTAAQHSLDVWVSPAAQRPWTACSACRRGSSAWPSTSPSVGRSSSAAQMQSDSVERNRRGLGLPGKPAGVAACRLGCLDPLRLLCKAVGAAPNGAHDRIVARHGTARHGTARHGTARHGIARSVALSAAAGEARRGEARRGEARQCSSHALAVSAV